MIHQHFKLVDVFSAMDNIVLGTKGKRLGRKALPGKKLKRLDSHLDLKLNRRKGLRHVGQREADGRDPEGII